QRALRPFGCNSTAGDGDVAGAAAGFSRAVCLYRAGRHRESHGENRPGPAGERRIRLRILLSRRRDRVPGDRLGGIARSRGAACGRRERAKLYSERPGRVYARRWDNRDSQPLSLGHCRPELSLASAPAAVLNLGREEKNMADSDEAPVCSIDGCTTPTKAEAPSVIAAEAGPTHHLAVISDAICPWCYVGKRRLEKALTLLPETVRLY